MHGRGRGSLQPAGLTSWHPLTSVLVAACALCCRAVHQSPLVRREETLASSAVDSLASQNASASQPATLLGDVETRFDSLDSTEKETLAFVLGKPSALKAFPSEAALRALHEALGVHSLGGQGLLETELRHLKDSGCLSGWPLSEPLPAAADGDRPAAVMPNGTVNASLLSIPWAAGPNRSSPHCDVLRKRADLMYKNADTLDGRIAFMQEYVKKTSGDVMSQPLEPADPTSTDRVVVIFLYAGFHDSARKSGGFGVKYSIWATMQRLGPGWALHIFYGADKKEQIEKELGDAADRTLLSPIVVDNKTYGSANTSAGVYNRWLCTEAMWKALSPKHEHVLILQDDSVLLKESCVDEFLRYDLVGAPWAPYNGFGEGGNGGFSLRKRSSNLRMVELDDSGPRDTSVAGLFHNEDLWMSHRLARHGGSFASYEDEKRFSVESQYFPRPCAIHKAWVFVNLGQLQTILDDTSASDKGRDTA
eukprot:TRINITY_DN49257_c0_g1_i1.p1 TRINITY_DN49257_c0_g1~~TRINITY_DN49257_c0_g1_i1.p1  ORF type:complete len:478 (-),score=94.06 TRINITY_DN49257_c0_g1_i1:401-1834(-)